MKLFNILNKDGAFADEKGVTIKNLEEFNGKIKHAYAMVKDGSYREDLFKFLTTIYSLFPIQKGHKRRMSIAEQLVSVIKDNNLYSNVSVYMFLEDLHKTIYTDEVYNFNRYQYLLETINENRLHPNELNKKLVWTFKNPDDKHLQCNDEVNILLNKIGALQLVRALDLFYNLPVKKG